MRINGLNYLGTWNRRVPAQVMPFVHFGFIRPGVTFECRRTVSWNESRLAKGLRTLRLPNFSAKMYGFETCPWEVGFFHHACWLGGAERLSAKISKSSHLDTDNDTYRDHVAGLQSDFVASEGLPRNIREWNWQPEFWE